MTNTQTPSIGCAVDSSEETMAIWGEAKKLAQACENMSNVTDDQAEKNRIGFQYGDRFIRY